MNPHRRSLSPISSSVDQLRRQFGLGAVDSVVTLTGAWAELVGEGPAANSSLAHLRGGVLSIDAYDPATAEVLGWARQSIVEAARGLCPHEPIESVVVRVKRRPRAQ